MMLAWIALQYRIQGHTTTAHVEAQLSRGMAALHPDTTARRNKRLALRPRALSIDISSVCANEYVDLRGSSLCCITLHMGHLVIIEFVSEA